MKYLHKYHPSVVSGRQDDDFRRFEAMLVKSGNDVLRDIIGDLELYSQDSQQLKYVSVKINDIQVNTFFHFFDLDDALNLNSLEKTIRREVDRQSRLDYVVFFVNIFLLPDLESEAIIKIFLAPKYNSDGSPISLRDNWMNFTELDLFEYKPTGQNTIVRRSDEFFYKEGDVLHQLYKFLDDTPDVEEIRFQLIVLVYRL